MQKIGIKFGIIGDNISNIFTVFSFATRKYEFKKLNSVIEKEFIPSQIKVYKYSFFTHIIAGLFYWVMLISLFLFVIYFKINNQITNGDVVFIMTITLKISWELWQIVQKLQDFMKNIGDLKSLFSIMQIPHNSQEFISKNIIPNAPLIHFKNIDFSYQKGRSVFNHFNLAIKPYEKIGLVGASGAGKSTLISLLLKYITPESGQILLCNQDITTLNDDSLRSQIAVIPQDIMLFHRSIYDNIHYGNLLASKEEVYNAAHKANIYDFIMSLPDKFDTMVGERGIKLSGGQRQRIAIARAILKKAPVLILDEATSSLDTETEQLIQNSLNLIFNEQNTTVIAIAHRLSTIRHMDRIVVLEHGLVVEEGRHEDLINNAQRYQRLWEMQKI